MDGIRETRLTNYLRRIFSIGLPSRTRHQLIRVANPLHQWNVDLFDANAADSTGDPGHIGMERLHVNERTLEVRPPLDLHRQGESAVARQPAEKETPHSLPIG